MSPAVSQRSRAAEKRAASRRRDRATEKIGLRVSSGGVRFGVFSYTFLRHVKGQWSRQPLAMEPWQLELYSELLEVERDVWIDLQVRHLRMTPEEFWAEMQRWLLDEGSEARGLRVVREGLLGFPKKNAKSTGAGGLALYLLTSDGEEGPEVYSLARAKDQARIVFNVARTMVEKSPRLLEIVQVGRGHTTTAIFHPASDGVYKAISADSDLHEGINPSGAVADEIHIYPSRALYDNVRAAMVAREQPLLVGLTTAGVTFKAKGGRELNLLGDLYQRGAGRRPKYRLRKLHPALAEHGHKVEHSLVEPTPTKSRRFFFKWFEVPYRHRENPRYWLAANPIAYMTREKIQDEADVERPRGIFYRYHCNITTAVEKHWLPSGKLAKTRAPKLAVLERDQHVVATVDVGLNYDTTAISATRIAQLGERLATRSFVLGVHDDPKAPPPPAHFLLPEGPVSLDDVENVVRALSTGDWRAVPGDLAAAARDAFGLDEGVPLTVVMVAADPNKFETQLQHLDDEGFQTLRFGQGEPMTLASEALFREVASKDAPLAQPGDDVWETHMENAAARDVGGGRWRLDKKRAEDKMDAAVSTAMGVYLARDPEIANPPRPSVTIL